VAEVLKDYIELGFARRPATIEGGDHRHHPEDQRKGCETDVKMARYQVSHH
jgi:hypothetical protein